MGAWGVGPLDNDTAGDWFGTTIRRKVSETVSAVLSRSPKRISHRRIRQYEEARAAIEVMLRFPEEFAEADFMDGIEALDAIRSDDEYVGMWNDGQKLRRAMHCQETALKKHLAAFRRAMR